MIRFVVSIKNNKVVVRAISLDPARLPMKFYAGRIDILH